MKSNESFRVMIESADLPGLQALLTASPELANQCIEWYLNQRNTSDPLHYVCDCVFNECLEDSHASQVAALLIENGALINGSEGSESPLIAACSLGAELVAKLLIESGADLEKTRIFGARALHWAAALGMPNTVDALLQHGAALEAKCQEYESTPLYWAVVGFGPNGPNKKKDPLASAKVLLEAGARVDTNNNAGVSALECSQQTDSQLMHELLQNYTTEK